MPSFARTLILLSLGLSLASCSFVDRFDGFHVSDAAVGDGGTLTAETFLPLFFDGLCTKAIRCETKLGVGGVFQLLCNPNMREQFLARGFGGLTAFDPTVAQACLDGLASIDCSVSDTLFDPNCARLLTSTIANGATCASDLSCAEGRCDTAVPGCGSVCVAKGADGAACSNLNSDLNCNSGLRCRQGTCQSPGATGDACDDSSDCQSLLWCDATQTCQPLPNVGDTCVVDGTTDYADPCRGSLVCALVGSGPDCTCQPGGTATQACDADKPCAPGHRCSTGTCHKISSPGGACISKDDCPSTFECIAEICTPFGAVGDTCSPTLPCIQGSCVGNVCSLLADGSMCNGSNGLFEGECEGYCDTSGMIFVCAPKQGAGAACAGPYDEFTCQSRLGCTASAGTYSCESCP